MAKKVKKMNSKLKVTIGDACIEIEGSNEMIHALFNESIERLNRKGSAKKISMKSEISQEAEKEEHSVFDEKTEISEEWSNIEGIIIQNRTKTEEEY